MCNKIIKEIFCEVFRSICLKKSFSNIPTQDDVNEMKKKNILENCLDKNKNGRGSVIFLTKTL